MIDPFVENHDTVHDGSLTPDVPEPPKIPFWNLIEHYMVRKGHKLCEELYGHCFHPIGFAVDWRCCMCLMYLDGLPNDECRVCRPELRNSILG